MFLKLMIAAIVASGSAAVVGIGGTKITADNKKPSVSPSQPSSTGGTTITPQPPQQGGQQGPQQSTET